MLDNCSTIPISLKVGGETSYVNTKGKYHKQTSHDRLNFTPA